MGSIDKSVHLGKAAGHIGFLDPYFCPRYDSLFVVTNDKGLTCSVKVTKELNILGEQKCEIILEAWSYPLMYFRTNSETYSYIQDIRSIDNENIWNNGMNVETYYIFNRTTDHAEQIAQLYYLNLDGIVYVAAGAFIRYQEKHVQTTTNFPSTLPTIPPSNSSSVTTNFPSVLPIYAISNSPSVTTNTWAVIFFLLYIFV
eukprot:71717_1